MKLWIQENDGIGHATVGRFLIADFKMIDGETMAVLVDRINTGEIDTRCPFDLD